MSELTDVLAEVKELLESRILNYKKTSFIDANAISSEDIEIISNIQTILSAGSGGSGGDASAANQLSEIEQLESISSALGEKTDASTNTSITTNSIISIIKGSLDFLILINNRLSELYLDTNSLRQGVGGTSSTAATSDTANASIVSLVKRLLSEKLDINLSSLRDTIVNALLNQSKTITATTTLSATGIFDIPFNNYNEFVVIYTVTNYSSNASFITQGGILGSFDNLDVNNRVETIAANGTFSMRGSNGRGIETLRINYTGNATVNFKIGYQ